MTNSPRETEKERKRRRDGEGRGREKERATAEGINIHRALLSTRGRHSEPLKQNKGDPARARAFVSQGHQDRVTTSSRQVLAHACVRASLADGGEPSLNDFISPERARGRWIPASNETIRMWPIRGLRYAAGRLGSHIWRRGPATGTRAPGPRRAPRGSTPRAFPSEPAIKLTSTYFFRVSGLYDGASLASTPTHLLVA